MRKRFAKFIAAIIYGIKIGDYVYHTDQIGHTSFWEVREIECRLFVKHLDLHYTNTLDIGVGLQRVLQKDYPMEYMGINAVSSGFYL